VNIKPEFAKESVEAFGKVGVNPLFAGAKIAGGISLGAALTGKALGKKEN
jgi:hypothetical protein